MRRIRQSRKRQAIAITRVSSYDKWMAWLIASVILLAFMVMILFGIWLTLFGSDTDSWSAKKTRTFEFNEHLVSRPMSPNSFDQPDFGELPEARPFQMQQALQAVCHTPSTLRGWIKSLSGTTDQPGQIGEKGLDGRKPGTDEQEENIIPEWERWKLVYESESRDEYYKILDSFDIYLGAVYQTSNKVCFLKDLADKDSRLEIGSRESDKAGNLYFRNVNSGLRTWDKSRIESAGVDPEDAVIVVHFIPEELQASLLKLEVDIASKSRKELREIERTTFRCRENDGEYEYYVEDIKYRPDPG